MCDACPVLPRRPRRRAMAAASRPGGRLGAAADRDALGLHFGALAHGQAQDAALQLGVDRVGIGAVGQREAAPELPVVALDVVVLLALLRLLALALAADRERVAADLDVEVLLAQPRH